jgi:hypothetical protein
MENVYIYIYKFIFSQQTISGDIKEGEHTPKINILYIQDISDLCDLCDLLTLLTLFQSAFLIESKYYLIHFASKTQLA